MPVLPGGLVVSLLGLGWFVYSFSADRIRTRESDTPQPAITTVAIPSHAVEYEGILDVTDAAVLGEVWFLLDRHTFRVHVLAPGENGATGFARQGTGPGELTRPSAIVVHGDTVVVVERLGGTIHLFDREGLHLGDRRIRAGGCRIPLIADAVSTPDGLVFLITCPGVRLNTKAFAVLEVAGAESRVLSSTASRPTPGDRIDPFFTPVLATHRDGVVFGAAGDECLAVVQLSGAAVGSLCPDWLERLPVPRAARAELQRLRTQSVAFGARVDVPDALPPFDRLFADGDSTYAFRVPTPGGGSVRRLRFDPATHDSQPRLPSADFLFAGAGQALLGWESAAGIRIARYRLPW